VQWYTFWAAISVLILTIFFDLVQSMEGRCKLTKLTTLRADDVI
jgi:hypothetical protein